MITTDDAQPVLTVDGLHKRYGQVTAVADVSFALSPGTITGLLGPNGAGKTTTLRLLLGLASPTAGQARVFGRRYRELAEPARLVGAVLESDDFDPGRTGRNHLRVIAVSAGLDEERVDEMLDLVGLTAAAGRRVGGYSLGMRQRLGLAAALLGDPLVLVLDEPANGLDPKGAHWLRGLLRDFACRGGTVLISSHVLTDVAQTVDHVVIIDDGRVAAAGTLAELTAGGRSLEEVYLLVTGAVAA